MQQVVCVIAYYYFPSIGVGMESGEAILNTKHLFVDLAIKFFSLLRHIGPVDHLA